MRFVQYASVATLALLVFSSLPTQADVLVINTSGALSRLSVPGQSVTTPTGVGFNNISFNWFDDNGNPNAVGTLFILTQPYAGLAGDLSAATPGFLAASQSIAGGEYIFDPTNVVLQGATQYYFFNNAYLTFLGDGNRYRGGIIYLPDNDDITMPFIDFPRLDANFRLSGTVVPEPSTFAFLTGSVLTGAAFLRRRKQAQQA